MVPSNVLPAASAGNVHAEACTFTDSKSTGNPVMRFSSAAFPPGVTVRLNPTSPSTLA